MQYFKKYINLFIVIALFIILCISYILIIPVFEAPDENWHFMYVFYMSKYNKTTAVYNENITYGQYIKENANSNQNPMFFIDKKYMIYKWADGEYIEHITSRLHPPIYYFISSQIIKPLKVSNIDAEYNHGNFWNPNLFIHNKILKDRSPTNSSVLILRFFQIFYGVLIIIFLYKIIKLLSDDEFENNAIILLSGIAFLPQFVFLCSYVNNDVLSALFGLISVYFSVLLFKRDKAYLGAISVLFAVIGGFTKNTIFIMVPITIIAIIVWLVIKKKKILASLGIIAIAILSITAVYYVVNFEKDSYEKTKIKAGWEEKNTDKSIEDLDNMPENNFALNLPNGKMVNFGNSDIFNIKNQSWTIELWIKSGTGQKPDKTFFSKMGWNNGQGGWGVYTSHDDSFYFQMRNPDLTAYIFYVYRPAIINNEWVHMAWSCNRISPNIMEVSSYQNGHLLGTETRTDLTGNFSNELDTSLGFDLSETVAVDEVRIWNVARTQEQIQSGLYRELTGDEEGLVGYWNFNKGRGPTVYDSTANKNSGTIFNIKSNLPQLLDRLIRTSNEILKGFREGKYKLINIPSLTITFKSTVAVFGWMNIYSGMFVYNFFLAYLISGLLLFFANIRIYKKNLISIIFILLTIISIFIYFLVYAASTGWAQRQGRIILLVVFLTYILAILGFKSIKAPRNNILYWTLFLSPLFINVFCLYNYIYLAYY
jgi:hypothetical protein